MTCQVSTALQLSQVVTSPKQQRANARTARNKNLRDTQKQSSGEHENLVPKRLLDDATEEIRAVRDELQQAKAELQRERDMCHRLQETLLEKTDAVFKSQQMCSCTTTGPPAQSTFTNLQNELRCMNEDAEPVEQHWNPTVHEEAMSSQEVICPAVQLRGQEDQAIHEEPPFVPVRVDSQLVNGDATPIATLAGGPVAGSSKAIGATPGDSGHSHASSEPQITIGDAVAIPADKIAVAMESNSDSIFVRELARSL